MFLGKWIAIKGPLWFKGEVEGGKQEQIYTFCDSTIHAFSSNEWGKGKRQEISFDLSFKENAGMLTFTWTFFFQISMHEKQD